VKRRALLAVIAVPGLAALGLAGCPAPDQPVGPPPGPGSVSNPASATSGTASAKTWADQAEVVARMLDAVVVEAEKGDKTRAVAACKDAYFVGYENVDRNLEVASMTNLPEEMLDGKPRNVKIVREDLFAQIQRAVNMGAPVVRVRALVDELANKIRDDAKTLDQAHVQPR
jgi:hypothetical protein